MKLYTKIFIVMSVAWLLPWPAFGAAIHFSPSSVPVPQPQSYTVTITVDTSDVSLNAIDGVVVVSKELGSDVQISDSGSIITYWIQQPTWNAAEHTITFSGAVPGGYNGSSGILFSVILPPYNGFKMNNALTVTNVHSYANDGLGTPVTIDSKQFGLGDSDVITDLTVGSQLYLDNNKPDGVPPETFSPQVTRDERVFDGKWFVTFATTDKQSGIDHYEIQESVSGRIDSGKWNTAQSPYLLQDQGLHSFIYITAIDRQGNERVIKVFPKNASPWWYRYGLDVAILGGIIVIVALGYWYHRRKVKKDTSISSVPTHI